MDCRQIKEEPRHITDGKYLEEIYQLQKTLIDHYVDIEGLPQYPIDVNTKSSQVILKDFTGRIIEELAEGYESHLEVWKTTKKNLNWSQDYLDSEYEKMLNDLQNYNEELADAMHFFVELLIYVNIQPEDIKSWMLNFSQNNWGYNLFEDLEFGDDILRMAMYLGNRLNDSIFQGFESDTRNQVAILNNFYSNGKYQTEEWKSLRKLIPAGSLINQDLLSESGESLWAVTYHLNISRNCLKNKPWKQTGVMTNETLYQYQIVYAFIDIMGYFAKMGLGPMSLYYLYFKKNRVNRFRQISKY